MAMTGLARAALLAAVAAAPALAEGPLDLARPALKVYTDRDGLPENSIFDIEVDRRGYLWVATENGAAWYDGRRWHPLAGEDGAGSGFVRDMLAASDGSLWLAMDQTGLYRRSEESFHHFSTATGFPSDNVARVVEQERPGLPPVVWAGTSAGLVRMEGDRWQTFGSAAGLPDERVTALLPDGAGGLWVGTMSGVVHFDGARFDASIRDEPGAPRVHVRDLLLQRGADGAEALWVALDSDGLAVHEGGAWRQEPVPHPRLTSLLLTEESAGPTLWVGTYGRGVMRIRRDSSTLLEGWGLPNETIRALKLTTSPEGLRSLWIGTQGGGLVKVSLHGWRALDRRLGLPSDFVGPITETRDADGGWSLWLGTNRGLVRLTRDRLEVLDRSTGLPEEDVVSLAAVPGAGGDELWVGFIGIVGRLADGRWTFWDGGDGLPPGGVFTAIEATGDGTVWAGSYGAGMARYRDGRWQTLDATEGPLNQTAALLTTVGPGGAPWLWVGSARRGLARVVDGSTGPLGVPAPPSTSVQALLETRSPDGASRRLWLGSRGGGGPFYLDLDRPGAGWVDVAGRVTEALPSSTIELANDAAGRIYAYTPIGVARLTPRAPTADDPAEFAVRRFRTYDGLPSDRCNYRGAFVDHQGRLWAGTLGGAAFLEPAQDLDDRTAKPLYVERALVGQGGTRFAPGAALPHDHGRLRFELSLLSTHRETESRFRTELAGFDEGPSDWEADASREVTNLPAGRYAFRAWGRDWAGNVSGPVELAFTVRPAPWSWWGAYLLYAALGVWGIVALVRQRTRLLQQRTAVLESRVAERTAALKASEEQALKASQAKGAFLAKMSHELRTPLNAILGFTQIMAREEGRGDRDRERLATLNRSGEHLLELINDVLSLAQIESGRLTLHPATFDLAAMLEHLRELFSARAGAKGLALTLELGPDLPPAVTGDEGKLRQVLVNLLGNAIKFTDRGGVAIRVSWAAGRGRFEVSDSGPGISEADQRVLFEAFAQGRDGRRDDQGAGLGLAISAGFVELMGGELAVDSRPGAGSRFHFAIDLPEAESATARPRAAVAHLAAGQPEVRALVVDDIGPNREVLAELLAGVGITVETAAGGAAALAAWQRRRPQVVFVDAFMPEMDGAAVAREIRRREAVAGGPRTLVVAVSASAFDHDRDSILAAGADRFVPKPVVAERLWEVLEQHLGVAFVRTTGGDRAAVPAAPAAALAALPEPWRRALAADLARGDLEAAGQRVAEIAGTHPAEAAVLRAALERFDVEGLLAAIDPPAPAAGG